MRITTSCLLNARWTTPVFSAAGSEFDWVDVFLAAMLRGNWNDFARIILDGLCLETAMADTDDWPDEERVHEAATAYRYDHDLLTAEELTTWLDERELSHEGWTAFFARRLMREASSAPAVDDGEVEIEVTDEVFAAEGLCSGEFDRLANMLAGRVAVVAGSGLSTELSTLEQRVTRVLDGYATWLEGLNPAELERRLRRLADIQIQFEAAAAAAITDRSLANELGRHLIDWTRLDLERLSFTEADAAREAALCVREDGLSLGDIAIETHQMVNDMRVLLEDVEPELRDLVLSADVDTLVGPVLVGERHELAWVAERMPPRLDDPLVRARAEQAVVDQMLSKAILAQIRWT